MVLLLTMESFSQRHGYHTRREIVVREDAPEPLRAGLLGIPRDMGLSYNQMREVICPVLHTFPDSYNWSEIPNLRDEVIELVRECDWYRVYDICEAIYRYLSQRGEGPEFAERLNLLFEEHGIGWQMQDGQIVTRGPEEFEHAVSQAMTTLVQAGYHTPKTELEEARRDLSRRPDPDVTGAVQHCMAALECTARTLSNDPSATLGRIMQNHAIALGIPRPLDSAIEKVWGYASEIGRHLQEGRTPSREEAELLLGMAAAVITYLLQKTPRP